MVTVAIIAGVVTVVLVILAGVAILFTRFVIRHPKSAAVRRVWKMLCVLGALSPITLTVAAVAVGDRLFGHKTVGSTWDDTLLAGVSGGVLGVVVLGLAPKCRDIYRKLLSTGLGAALPQSGEARTEYNLKCSYLENGKGDEYKSALKSVLDCLP